MLPNPPKSGAQFPIQGYVEVSSRRGVRSLDYMGPTSPRAGPRRHIRDGTKAPANPPTLAEGTKYIGLCAVVEPTECQVHHLVLQKPGVGPCPDGMECLPLQRHTGRQSAREFALGHWESNTEDRRGRHIKTHCSKGHEYTPENAHPQEPAEGRSDA